MKKINTVIVSKKASGQKLYQFLEKYLNKQVPRSAIMKWIRTGQVRLDGKRTKPFERIYQGQEVRIPPHSMEDVAYTTNTSDKNPFLLKKIYEDENLLVLYKPPYLPTQPGKNIVDSVYHRVKRMYPKDPPYLVHRLDKHTSGLLLLAKNYLYLQHIQELLQKRKITKVYLAWVLGTTNWSNWTKIKDDFFEHRDNKKRKVNAISFVKTLENKKSNSLVAVSLVTGRKHQIRIQLSKRGHPIIGEKKYAHISSSQGLLLHAYLLKWDKHKFTCPPPWTDIFHVGPDIEGKIFPLKFSLYNT